MPTTTIIRDATLRCEAKKHAYRQTQDGVVVSFVLHPQEVPDGLATAPLGTRYMMVVVEIGDDEQPIARIKPESEVVPDRPDDQPSLSTPEHKNGAGGKRAWSDLSPAQQAGIRCNEASFQRFLRERGLMETCTTADDAATYVRFICGVHSRAKIGADQSSLVKWHDLDTEFQAWLTDPSPVPERMVEA